MFDTESSQRKDRWIISSVTYPSCTLQPCQRTRALELLSQSLSRSSLSSHSLLHSHTTGMHPPPPVPPRSYFQHPSRQLPPPHHFPPPHQPQLGAASTTTGVPLPSQESLFSAQRLPAPSFEPFRVRSKRSISPVPRERRRGDWDADDAERMRRWSPHDASLSTSRVREEGSYRTRDREYDRDERRRRRVPDEVYEGRMSERRRSEGGSSRRNRSPSRERDRDRDRDRRRSVSRGLSLRMPWEAERDDGSRSASSSAVRRSRRASLWSGEVDDGVRDVGRLLARSQREESRYASVHLIERVVPS